MELINIDPGKEPGYEMKESLRTFRTNIAFCGTDVRVIMFTSCMPDEGKSTVVFNLGKALLGIQAAYQAQKCADPKDREAFTAMNPAEAKKAGRTVTIREDWKDVKISVMTGIVRAKFEQNPDLAGMLLATKDAYLEEGNNWGDRVWGTVNGEGANNLGLILMDTRKLLQSK